MLPQPIHPLSNKHPSHSDGPSIPPSLPPYQPTQPPPENQHTHTHTKHIPLLSPPFRHHHEALVLIDIDTHGVSLVHHHPHSSILHRPHPHPYRHPILLLSLSAATVAGLRADRGGGEEGSIVDWSREGTNDRVRFPSSSSVDGTGGRRGILKGVDNGDCGEADTEEGRASGSGSGSG